MEKIKQEIRAHKFIYAIVFVLLLYATYVRVYGTSKILGFYYDQGRDALVIADLLEKGKWFLIGPTTGIAGIFRGPFYYYLIAPAYWLGRGDPLYPALFLELMSASALALLYYLAKEGSGRLSGIFAVILAGFSYYIVYASRWLSNPTPMLLLSLSLVWMMLLITRGKKWAWIPLSFIAGASLFHFGSSGEFFYFPALFVFCLWQFGVFKAKLKLPSISIIASSVVAFLVTAAPLVIFDLRHDRILTKNITQFFVGDGSFKANFWDVANARVNFLSDSFYSKIFLSKDNVSVVLIILLLATALFRFKKLWRSDVFKISSLLLISPWIGLMFFQGNEGNIYDYYLTGYYLIFILWVALVMREMFKPFLGKIIVLIFLVTFYRQNIQPIWSWSHDNVDGPQTIAFGNQKQAVDWVYADSQGQQFNVDEYVPPVIPYTYNYLFRWYGKTHTGNTDAQVPLLYTIYEVDPPHPERLEAWLKRQAGIGKVISETHFGGIYVQRRERIPQK